MRKRRNSTDASDVFEDEEDEPLPRRRLRAFDYDEDDEGELPRPRQRRYDDEEEEDEDYRDLDFELLQTLCHVENYSHSLKREQANVARLIRNNPPLAAKWKEFTSQGGIGAKDFENFLNGKLRTRLTRGKKHLRLVSSRQPVRIRLRRPQDDDPEAA